jgi:hypothetical protein
MVHRGRLDRRHRPGRGALTCAGDVVYTAPDEWHWHGAAPDHFMTHLSITEGVGDDERPEANWGDHVTDDEYRNR